MTSTNHDRSRLDPDLDLRLTQRWPCRLPPNTESAILDWPVPSRGRPVGRPSTSIIMVTFNALIFTKFCLSTLFAHTRGVYQLILVDNASTDGTAELVAEVADRSAAVEAILNPRNLGFAAATNLGLERASGRNLVLLNSDTLVGPGWLSTLTRHLDASGVGLVSPVTNRCGTACEIETDYRTWGEFLNFAKERRRRKREQATPMEMLSMFCLALRRDVHETLGPLDEEFGVGLFEDDDYSFRSLRAGYLNLCAEDCFIHHFGQASFGQLGPSARYQRLLERNRRQFEEKWGTRWSPREARPSENYLDLRARIARLLSRLPTGSRVLVVSRGDDQLISESSGRALHFPQDSMGAYAGYHPADSRECIQQLEHLRRRGAGFLLFPATARWWLEHYRDFALHLESTCQKLLDREDTGILFRLPSSAVAAPGSLVSSSLQPGDDRKSTEMATDLPDPE